VNPDAVAERVALQRDRAAALTQEVADWLAPLRGRERVLDSGCGTGAFALAIAGLVGSVVGIDADEASLAAGRETAPANVELIRGDAASLPFEDASFDLAGCFRVLHHVPEPGRIVDELARVVAPAGRALLVDQLRDEDTAAAEAADRFERERDPSHTRTLTAEEIHGLLVAAGFAVVRRDVVVEQRTLGPFLDLVGLTGAERDRVRALAPAETWSVEVGWFLARR